MKQFLRLLCVIHKEAFTASKIVSLIKVIFEKNIFSFSKIKVISSSRSFWGARGHFSFSFIHAYSKVLQVSRHVCYFGGYWVKMILRNYTWWSMLLTAKIFIWCCQILNIGQIYHSKTTGWVFWISKYK